MEVVTSLPNGMNGTSGGTKKHIQEWSRLDKFTGMLEHARVEADHWASTTSNSRHHFGKVVDSRARNLADGSVQQKHQTKQLEVFQAQIPGGSVQVIRSHTSTTSSWHNSKVIQSHSSSWSSNSSGNVLNHANKMGTEIDDLKFEHNPVNLDSEKTKVNVARQLTNRRPPTRSRISKTSSNDSSFTNLPITYFSNEGKEAETNISSAETESSKKKLPNNLIENDLNHSSMELNRQKLGEKKSVSDENLSITSQLNDEKLEEKENSDPWIRSSKTRWSFQYPSRYKNKLTENPTEKNQNNKSELESVLEKVLRRKGDFDSYSKIPCELDTQKPLLLRKKSFVTEKTLQETKRKLRHMNFDKILSKNRETDNHGFIENENNPNDKNESINGNQKYKSGTSEYQLTNCSESRNINKTNDWFDRRKSYGFESVGIQHSTSALNDIPKTNSSIDSGICQSSELEFASTSMIKKMTAGSEDRLQTSNFENTQYHEFPTKNEVSELMQKFEKFDKSRHAATTPTLVEKSKYNVPDIAGSQQDVIEKGKVLQTVKNFEKNGVYCKTSEPLIFTKTNSYNLEPTPKTSTSDFSTSEQDFLFKRHSIACDDIKYMNPTFANSERPFPEKITLPGQFTVINVNNFEPNLTQLCSVDNDNKKPKKVEFSKTEVHFAATEPGKIKIVETDEKPPPANLYRRKKRSVSVSPKSELSQNKLNESDKRLSDDVVNQRLNDGTVFNPEFTSTATDNGLAVTISSIKPTNYRRASWSVIENSSPVQLDNKAGYSTKINFGGERIIVVADSKSPQHEMVHQSIAGSKDTEDEIRNTDISEKSYFKPLKTDEDKLKIITNASDVKKPKIASIAIKLDDSWADDKSSGNSKQCSTILLNKSNDNSNSTFLNENISGEINDHVNEKRISPECKTESPLKMYDIGETDKGNELKEHESSKVIYHNLKIKSKEQSVVNGNEKKNHSPKKNDNSEKNRKKSSSKEVGNNCSMKRRTNHIINKEKLPNSGRDGWLNLPKERKPTFEKNKVDHEKHELHRKPYSDRAKKSERTNMSGCGDITSEEDFPRKNKLYKPLQKIDEKIKITDTSPKLSYTKNRSNQTVENRSNMFESRNPVLKTEERSRRRAARMLHSISNREAVNSNMASSSDDITSENEMNYSRCSKPRIVRKAKLSPKNRNPVSTANLPASNKVVTSTASMQINIFNIKNRTDNEKRNSRLYTSGLKIGDNVSSKSTFFAGQREVPSNLSEKKIRPTLSSNRNSKKNSSSSLKSTRLVH